MISTNEVKVISSSKIVFFFLLRRRKTEQVKISIREMKLSANEKLNCPKVEEKFVIKSIRKKYKSLEISTSKGNRRTIIANRRKRMK
jgi:hypothetical protein